MAVVHFIGIGGTGLSAIARVLLESGYTVTGSDRLLSPLARSLQQAGVRVYEGHAPEYVQGADLVIRSSAIPDDHPEVLAAQRKGIPVMKRSDFLGSLMADRLGIAVAGTHGKTTTTAMVAWILSALGQDPSFIAGGVLKNLGTNARAGKGRPFVIEADEYDRMFLGLNMQVAVITNIEHDHPDCFPTPQDYVQAFREFVQRLPQEGWLLACVDDLGARSLFEEAAHEGVHALGYGISTGLEAVIRGEDLRPQPEGGFAFVAVVGLGGQRLNVSLQVPGVHNVRNALAALGVAWKLGLPLSEAAQALGAFQGTGRRFEVVGEVDGITLIDDYAHHPTEIQATLAAARARYPGRSLWAVWQPHTYSRTRSLLDQFIAAFADADHVLVTEVYPAREPVDPDFSSRQIVASMCHPDAKYLGSLAQATGELLSQLHSGDVLLVLSAGDADQISMNVLSALKERSNAHA
jgi:UDP-N-acetylmuramate--alanine ligase